MPDLKSLAESALQEVNPNSEIREGTPMHDVFVKAGQIIFQKYEDEFQDLRQMLFLDNYDEMDTDEMDAHASNYYVDRSEGRPSVGVIRLYFSNPRSLFYPEGETALGIEGTEFVTTEDIELTQNEMESQSENGLFYVDVPIESASDGEGHGEVIDTLQNSPTGLVRINTIDVPTGGSESESNAELHEKIGKKVGTRDLVQDESIEAQLIDEFNFINNMQTIGFRDPEMSRDTLPYMPDDNENDPSGEYHIGMHTDIYMQFQQLKQTVDIVDLAAEGTTVTDYPDDNRYLSVKLEDHVEDGALSLREVCIVNSGEGTIGALSDDGTGSTGSTELTIGGACQYDFPLGGPGDNASVSMKSLNPQRTFSARAKPRLIVPKGEIDDNGNLVTDDTGEPVGPMGTPNRHKVLALNYFYAPELNIVQDFLDDEKNRNTVSDLLARHYVPAFIDIYMEYAGSARESTIQAEFHEMIYQGNFVEVSDLISSAYELGADSVNLDALDVSLEVHNKEGEVIVNDKEITDKLTFEHPNLPPDRIRTLLPREIVIEKVG